MIRLRIGLVGLFVVPEHAGHRQIFINIRPVDAHSSADKLPMVSLGWCCLGQARIPYEWNH